MTHTKELLRPHTGKKIGIIGAPLGFGAGKQGVELGPAAMRLIKLQQRIHELGYQVNDYGDISIASPSKPSTSNNHPKYLKEILAACRDLSLAVENILNNGECPLVLGGDHSVAIGSLSGVSSYFHQHQESLGLIWFDAHADMNTPETSPSGNIHGMPLSSLLGYGISELVQLNGFAPKFDVRYCVHIGAREVDPGERELIHQLGMRFITMREIDERGMNACIDEAIIIASQASAGYAVTFDIDAMDPVDAPGSGTLVRGGLTYREAHLAMEKIADNGLMRSLELVEVNPVLDINNRTSELAVELILSALGKTII